MRKKCMDWQQPFYQCMALCRYVDGGGNDPRKVTEYWHRAFNCIAGHLGFNKVTRKFLWMDLVQGNWEHLHQTADEEKMTADEWLDKLKWDVFYISDRLSLDRLTRCHWFYRQYMEAAVDYVGMLEMMEESR